ncbi:MAG: hypothetical protein GXY55_07110 [Phycisphaerae bacterium]|nr:hypothetical protein [Phycisphaerae bacterium]
MSIVGHSAPPADGSRTVIADLLPATAPMPEPARSIHFCKAMLLYWLFPGRLGPHLAVSSWRRALAAHVLSILLVGLVLSVSLAVGLYSANPEVRTLHDLRTLLAESVITAANASTSGDIEEVLLAIAVIPLSELLLLVLAVPLMPWCAGGDSTRSVLRRSLKNVYWATTLLVPMALLYGFLWQSESFDRSELPEWLAGGIVLLLVGIVGVLVSRALLTGASRYVGPPDGPAFKPRQPRCDDCGYLIIGLPLDANCPECGTPVSVSLPGGRRGPLPWQALQFQPRGLAHLVRMQWPVLRDPDFFRRIMVHEGLPAARHFWWGTFLCMLLGSLGILAAVQHLLVLPCTSIHQETYAVVTLGAVASVIVPLLLQAMMMFLACLVAQYRLDIRDYRNSAIVCYYASPLMWPTLLAIGLAMLLATEPLASWLWKYKAIQILGVLLDGECLFAGLCGLMILGTLLFWWLRLQHALRVVRYANV